MKNIPDLGIGMIYFSGMKDVLESNFDLIDVIEVEPQTFWLKDREELDSFIFNEEEFSYLEALSKPLSFHGVGYPIGGSQGIDESHIPFLKANIGRFQPIWLSEHLSFNRIRHEGELVNTNFLLPPLQTEEGLEVICNNINSYKSNFDLPFLFETGTNYLRPFHWEIPDGTFVNEIAKRTDSYILLDIHNLLANHKNGRQDYWEFFDQIDPQRILQIHLAGGFEHEGYYLDAHSGISDNELLELYSKTIRRLPNLKVVTFEMVPEYTAFIPPKDLRLQFERMKSIWDSKGVDCTMSLTTTKAPFDIIKGQIPSVDEWEQTVGGLAINKQVEDMGKGDLKVHLQNDKGMQIIQGLVNKFRSSQLVSSLKWTCRYIMIKEGIDALESLFDAYWKNESPRLFGSDNGLAFARFLLDSNLEDKLLETLVSYEYHSLIGLMEKSNKLVFLNYNPQVLIEKLANRELPTNEELGKYEVLIEVDPDYVADQLSSVFHT